jgi:ParB/RepB/Spo0J family partition protein
MATSTDTVSGVQMIALSEIRHDQNVRQELLGEEVDALAQSIALLGQLTPVSVRPDSENGGYVLIAGHKRYAALQQLGHIEIRAEIRQNGEHEASERAAENLVRSQLNPPVRRRSPSKQCSTAASARTAPCRRSAGRRRASPRA